MSELTVWDEGAFRVNRKLGSFVQNVQLTQPQNGQGIPTSLVDPAALLPSLMGCTSVDDLSGEQIEEVLLPVEFRDGMALVSHVPIWDRLESEPAHYFSLFKEYREAYYVCGSRSMVAVAQTQSIPGKMINTLAQMYHWVVRCKAYDLYKSYEFMAKQEFEGRKILGRHRKYGETLVEKAMDWLEKHPEQLNAKMVIQMLEAGVKLERMSVGLPMDKAVQPSVLVQQNVGNGSDIADTVAQQHNHNTTTGTPQSLERTQSILSILERSGAFNTRVDVTPEIIEGN